MSAHGTLVRHLGHEEVACAVAAEEDGGGVAGVVDRGNVWRYGRGEGWKWRHGGVCGLGRRVDGGILWWVGGLEAGGLGEMEGRREGGGRGLLVPEGSVFVGGDGAMF